ncbi:hypothetical protein QQP08_018870 [Theobroma cacao]|nr:hypothetical protein QQP08_018870 [Theobroma cacao]
MEPIGMVLTDYSFKFRRLGKTEQLNSLTSEAKFGKPCITKKMFLLCCWQGVGKGLAEELSQEGACDRAIFPDTNIVVDGCVMIGNLSKEGGDRCSLDLVPGCMDPNSYLYNPLANVDDGSCLIDSDSED